MQCIKTTFLKSNYGELLRYSAEELQNITSVSIRDVRSGSRIGFIVHIILEEGTKSRLVLGREIQESPIFYCYTSVLQVSDKKSVSSVSMHCQPHDNDEQRW